MAAYRVVGDHVNGKSIESVYIYDYKKALEQYNTSVRVGVKNVKLYDVSNGGRKEIKPTTPKDTSGATAIIMIISAIPAVFLISTCGWFLGGGLYTLILGVILIFKK